MCPPLRSPTSSRSKHAVYYARDGACETIDREGDCVRLREPEPRLAVRVPRLCSAPVRDAYVDHVRRESARSIRDLNNTCRESERKRGEGEHEQVGCLG